MSKKKTLQMAFLGAALAASSFGGWSIAADAPAPTPPVQPQPPTDGPRGRRPSPADFLKRYRDQFEGLNLTDDQMKKIDAFMETAEAEVKTLAGKQDDDSRREAFKAFRKLNDDVQSVLNDTQKTALRQKRQTMMFERMKGAYTSADLKLSEEQNKKISDIFDAAKKEMGTLNFDNQDDRQKIGQMMRDTREKLNAVLTPEQQKQLPQTGPRGRRGGGDGTPPAGN